jgi:hypothetical protein
LVFEFTKNVIEGQKLPVSESIQRQSLFYMKLLDKLNIDGGKPSISPLIIPSMSFGTFASSLRAHLSRLLGDPDITIIRPAREESTPQAFSEKQFESFDLILEMAATMLFKLWALQNLLQYETLLPSAIALPPVWDVVSMEKARHFNWIGCCITNYIKVPKMHS